MTTCATAPLRSQRPTGALRVSIASRSTRTTVPLPPLTAARTLSTSTTPTCPRRPTGSRRGCRCSCSSRCRTSACRSGQRRRRRLDPLPRVHARAFEPARRPTPTASGALNCAQSGAMGEAWSDFYAKDFLVGQGLELDDPATDGEIDMGEYSDGERALDPHRGARLPGRRDAPACPAGRRDR